MRTTRTTKRLDRAIALRMAIEWESAAMKASEGRLSEAQARTVVNSIMEHAGQEPITFYKVRDWFTEWLEDKANSKKSSTAEKYEQVTTQFLRHIGRKAEGGLGNITVADIRGFRAKIRDEGRAASTVNDLISKILSAALAKATRLGYIPINPCAALEPLVEIDSEAGVFTVEQMASLLAAAPTMDWQGLILAGFYTGQRMGDLANLQWKQVDLNAQIITIEKQRKTGVGVAIPIHPRLWECLMSLEVSDDGSAPVFKSLAGKSGSGKSGLSETFKRIMGKAGISLEKRLNASGKAGRSRNKLSFHSLRHSFNSALANAGVAEEVRQKLTGHRDKDTHKIYTHLDLRVLKSAIDLVPSIVTRDR